jgi:predicted ATPase
VETEHIFIARPDMTAALDAAVARCREEGRQVLWLTGETGQGKTRFVRDYIERHRDDLIVSYVACPAPLGNQSTATLKPYQPLKDIFTDLLQHYADTRRRLQLVKNVSLTVLAMVPLVGDVFYGIKELRRDLTEFKRGEREVDFSTFARDCFDTLVRLSEEAPVVVVLDDIQWADALTIAALQEFLLAAAEDRPITFVLAGRPDDIGATPALGGMRSKLAPLASVRDIEMQPFDDAQLAAYVRAVFPARPPDADTLLWLERKTGGNPFFVQSYLHHLVSEGLLTADGAVQGDLYGYSGLPSEVRVVTSWLMKSLSEEDLTLLLTASVLGYEFSLHELGHLTARGVLDLVRALRRITAVHGILEPVGYRLVNGRESTVYRFLQHAVHTALYNELTIEEKEALHRDTARYLNELRVQSGEKPEVLNSIAGALMLHARLGHQPEMEYESILLKARNTEDALDTEAIVAQLATLAPALGMMPEDMERMFREALEMAPLVTKTVDSARRAQLMAEKEEGRILQVDALSTLVATVFAHLAAERPAEAVSVVGTYISRSRTREQSVHPLAYILYAVALLVHGVDVERATDALRTAAGDATQPDYAAFARVGLAVLAPSTGDQEALKLLREVARHEGRHARILRRAVALFAVQRFGGDASAAPLIAQLESLHADDDGDLALRYPRTHAALRSN